MGLNLSPEINRIASIMMEVFSAIIFLVILLTIVKFKEGKRSERRLFFWTSIFGLITTFLEILAYLIEVIRVPTILGIGILHMDCVILIVFGMLKTQFIMSYLDPGRKLNKVIKYLAMDVYVLLLLVHCIPPVFKMVYWVDASSLELVYGPLYKAFCIVFLGCSCCPIIALLMNMRKFGFRDSILLIFLQGASVITFFVVWFDSPPSMLLVAVLLLIVYINLYQGRIVQAIEKENELNKNKLALTKSEYELADMKTKILLSQIQPHFMYNVLTTIAYLCRKDPANAEKLTTRFSKYLRENISLLASSEQISFEKAMDNVDNYLAIEIYRFKDRVKVEYNIEVKDFTLPTLTIQPLVENAVKHGLCKKEEGGTIWISTREEPSYYIVEVKDDGVGFDEKAVWSDGKEHIGMSNVRKRLEMVGGKLEIDSVPEKGTTATIYIKKEA